MLGDNYRPIPATPTMAEVPIPHSPHCRQARIGASPCFVSSPFYSVPTETPGEGAASGRESRHSGGGGTARYGTVRHGTGVTTGGTEHSRHAHRHNVQRKRTRHRTYRWIRRPATLGPRSLQPPGPPPCLADCHNSGWGPGPAGRGCVPPVLAGTKARWRMCSGGEIGPGGGLGPACDLHTVQVFTARGVAGPAAGGRHPQALHLSSAGRGGGCARGRGSPPWGCPRDPRPTAAGLPPALGTGRAPGEGSATKRGLPAAAGSSITSA